MDLQQFLGDGGIWSRKLWLCVGGLVLLTAMVFVGCHYAAVAGMYTEYVGGVLGVLGVYTGTNIAGRMSASKHIGSKMVEASVKADATAPVEPLPPEDQ
jgi:hypothetical protein